MIFYKQKGSCIMAEKIQGAPIIRLSRFGTTDKKPRSVKRDEKTFNSLRFGKAGKIFFDYVHIHILFI